ncbi:MAG: class I SAM-dependent methyltransferase [Chloroflexi bacterium]|nr:class I SAM-dependent methyltransferase [Chloroflexota bacterium]
MNENALRYYEQASEREWERLERRWVEFHVNLHFISAHLAPASRVLDIGAGPGRYAIELAKRGHRVYVGDLSPELVRLAREKIKESRVSAHVETVEILDVRNLGHLDDASFDAVLALGPFYHLQAHDERKRAVEEIARVLKPGGVAFAAFIPRPAFMTAALLDPERWPPLDDPEYLSSFLQSGIFDHADPGRFTGVYCAQVDEIRPLFEAVGIQEIKIVASEGITAWLSDTSLDRIRQLDAEAFDQTLSVIVSVAEDPSTLGMSIHVMYIGRRI